MLLVVVACACAQPRPAPVTCGLGWSPLSGRHAPASMVLGTADRDVVITSVEVAGIDPALAATLRSVVETAPGQRVGDAPLAADLRRLWKLGVVADAHVEVSGQRVAFVVSPRSRVGTVIVARADPDASRRFRLLEGALFEPARITRIAAATELGYLRAGHLDAHVRIATAPRAGAIDVCVVAMPGPRVTVEAVRFPGRARVSEATLLGALHGAKGGVNTVGGIYDADALAADEPFLISEYFERGMINADIGAPRLVRRGATAILEIPVTEGPVFSIGAVSIPAAPAYDHGLVRGELFARSRLAEVRERLQRWAGDAFVVPLTSVDVERRRVDITFQIEWRWPWDALRSWSWPSR